MLVMSDADVRSTLAFAARSLCERTLPLVFADPKAQVRWIDDMRFVNLRTFVSHGCSFLRDSTFAARPGALSLSLEQLLLLLPEPVEALLDPLVALALSDPGVTVDTEGYLYYAPGSAAVCPAAAEDLAGA